MAEKQLPPSEPEQQEDAEAALDKAKKEEGKGLAADEASLNAQQQAEADLKAMVAAALATVQLRETYLEDAERERELGLGELAKLKELEQEKTEELRLVGLRLDGILERIRRGKREHARLEKALKGNVDYKTLDAQDPLRPLLEAVNQNG